MTNTLSANKVGLAFGGLLGLWHLCWSLLVAMGVAQALWDWILALHMISLPVVILPFNIVMAAELIIVTSVLGYVIGFVFALWWNYIHKK